MHIFILEDQLNRYPRSEMLEVLKGHNVTTARDIHEAADLYVPGSYDLLLLDHDLDLYFHEPEDSDTGYQFTKWLVNQELGTIKPRVILHSQNAKGARAMESLLRFHGWANITTLPFGSVFMNFLRMTYGKVGLVRIRI